MYYSIVIYTLPEGRGKVERRMLAGKGAPEERVPQAPSAPRKFRKLDLSYLEI